MQKAAGKKLGNDDDFAPYLNACRQSNGASQNNVQGTLTLLNAAPFFDINNLLIDSGSGQLPQLPATSDTNDSGVITSSEAGSVIGGGGKDVMLNNSVNAVFNVGSNVVIDTGAGNDLIDSGGDEVTINAGAGDNLIHVEGKNVFVTARGGENYIETNDIANAFIETGNGADYIENEGAFNTINSGRGEDFVIVEGERYALGGGNDIVEGFNATLTLQIALPIDDANSYTKQTVGSDVILSAPRAMTPSTIPSKAQLLMPRAAMTISPTTRRM